MASGVDPVKGGRVAFIGCGKMGTALLAGWMASPALAAQALMNRGVDVVVPTEAHAKELASRFPVEVFPCANGISEDVAIIILAVKPQKMDEVLSALASTKAATSSPLVISIAAGISTARIEDALPSAHVVRVMPNMPLAQGCGVTVVAGGDSAEQAQVVFVNDLLACLGDSFIVDEEQIDAVCALSGGGPAYFAWVAECLARAGEHAGLDPALARALSRQTLAGTGVCLAKTDDTLEELRQSVCSPGGTTLAALAAMEVAGMESAVDAGVLAAVERAKELSS